MIGSEVVLGDHFGECLRYVLEKDKERVEWVRTNNVFSKDHKLIAEEMEKISWQSSRCKTPLYHTSISWDPNDNPTKDQMIEVAEGYLKHMGLGEYQTVLAAHNDTEWAHVHIVVNRIHPDKGTAWELDTYIGKGEERKYDQLHNERVQKYLESVEKEYGWRRVDGKYRSGLEVAPSPTRSEYHREQKKNKQMEIFGMDPEEYDTRDPRLRAMDLKEQLFNCESFQEVDEVLDRKGLWVDAKGQGAVFTDGVHSVKASKINRHLSGPKMEERFGENLKEYINSRDQSIDAGLGYRQLVDWTRDLKLEELEKVSYIVEQRKDKKERKLKRFQYLENQYESILESLPVEFQEGFHNGVEAYQSFGKHLKDFNGTEEQAIADFVANPEQFGKVKDPERIIRINGKFQEAISLREQMKEHVQDLPGKSISDKKQHLKLNSAKAKKKLKDVNKRIVKELKSEYDYDDLYDPQAEEAKRTVQSGMYKALSMHRALHNIFSKAQSKRNKELSKLMGNVGLLMSNPGRGSAKILKQAIKVAGQKLFKDGRGRGQQR